MAAALTHGLVDHTYFLPELAATLWTLVAAVATLAVVRGAESVQSGGRRDAGEPAT